MVLNEDLNVVMMTVDSQMMHLCKAYFRNHGPLLLRMQSIIPDALEHAKIPVLHGL